MQAHMSIRCQCPITSPCHCGHEWPLEADQIIPVVRAGWRPTEDRDR